MIEQFSHRLASCGYLHSVDWIMECLNGDWNGVLDQLAKDALQTDAVLVHYMETGMEFRWNVSQLSLYRLSYRYIKFTCKFCSLYV